MADMYASGLEQWPRASHSILIEKSATGAEISNQLRHELPGVTAVIVSTTR